MSRISRSVGDPRSRRWRTVSPSTNSDTRNASAVVIADLVDRQDVGMIERRGGTSLLKKTADAFRIATELTAQDFERDRASERGINRLVDLAHAAAAQQAVNPIAADGGPRTQRHRRRRLYRRDAPRQSCSTCSTKHAPCCPTALPVAAGRRKRASCELRHNLAGRLNSDALVVEPESSQPTKLFAATRSSWTAMRAGRHDDPVPGVRVCNRRIDQ